MRVEDCQFCTVAAAVKDGLETLSPEGAGKKWAIVTLGNCGSVAARRVDGAWVQIQVLDVQLPEEKAGDV